MGKNTRGGKKHKKRKNGTQFIRPLILKDDDDQYYARVIKVLGGPIIDALVKFDDRIEERRCVIRGKMRRRAWMGKDDWILVSTRNTSENDKLDVIHLYKPDETKELSKRNEIDLNMSLDKESESSQNRVEISFDDL